MQRRTFVVAAWLLASVFPMNAAHAAFPDKPVKLVVPWATGGATDQLARLLAQPLSQALGVAVVVENRGGAGGVIGTQSFVKEKADGYTILLATSSTNAAAPHLYSKLGFDPVADFTPVISLCSIPNVMVVPVKSPWNSLADIVAAAKQSPDKYSYGSAGVGGSQHLAAAQFKMSTNTQIKHVPYKGSGPAAQDLMAGHIDMMIDTGSLGSIRSGLLRPIAVASEKRLSVLPNVPTFKEAGVAMQASAWYGLMLPAKAPADVVNRLNLEMNKILKSGEIRAKLALMGAEVGGGSVAQFTAFSLSEIKRYEGIVKASGAPKE
jgi:tripartite-type tricarboxylate transporter receptor subunit TctC